MHENKLRNSVVLPVMDGVIGKERSDINYNSNGNKERCMCVILKRRNDTVLNLTLWLINMTPSLHYVCVVLNFYSALYTMWLVGNRENRP